jgi:hypothetical protein
MLAGAWGIHSIVPGRGETTDGVQISVTYPDFSRTVPLGKSDWPQRHSDTSAGSDYPKGLVK